MTQGEKMIWAAIFAKEYICNLTPSFDEVTLNSAIEDACAAVRHLRSDRGRIKAEFEEHIVLMVKEMLED